MCAWRVDGSLGCGRRTLSLLWSGYRQLCHEPRQFHVYRTKRFMSETCGRKLAVWKLKCIYSTYGMKQSAPILSSIVPRSPRRESECERSGTRQVMEGWGGGRRSRKRGGQTQRAQSLSAAPLIRSRQVDRSGRWGRRVACGHRGVGAGGRPNESPSRCLLPTVRELHGR